MVQCVSTSTTGEDGNSTRKPEPLARSLLLLQSPLPTLKRPLSSWPPPPLPPLLVAFTDRASERASEEADSQS